jgi:ABC-type sugar transport system ATPase subunit
VGRFGITGQTQTLPIKHLSDGLKSRVVFSWLAQRTPHMLLLDEPTNHLDIETIDSLARAINGERGRGRGLWVWTTVGKDPVWGGGWWVVEINPVCNVVSCACACSCREV